MWRFSSWKNNLFLDTSHVFVVAVAVVFNQFSFSLTHIRILLRKSALFIITPQKDAVHVPGPCLNY